MKRTRLVLVLTLLASGPLVLLGCSGGSKAPLGDGTEDPAPGRLVAYTVSDTCAAAAKRTTAPSDSVGVVVQGSDILLAHMGMFNCCMDSARLELAESDQVLTLLEVEYTSEACRCVCPFEIKATIPVENPGVYTLRIEHTNALWGEKDTTLTWEGEVAVAEIQ